MLTALSNLELHVTMAQQGRFIRAVSQLKLNQYLSANSTALTGFALGNYSEHTQHNKEK